jgi:hypothetical protein
MPASTIHHFDAAGKFWGGVDEHGASVACLDVVTDGDPVLRLLHFRGNGIPRDITLPDGAMIQLENVGPGSGKGDADHDFLLNFKIAQSIPVDARWPTDPMTCQRIAVPFSGNTVGPGCSNSNYP